jgi:hypothetical protein
LHSQPKRQSGKLPNIKHPGRRPQGAPTWREGAFCGLPVVYESRTIHTRPRFLAGVTRKLLCPLSVHRLFLLVSPIVLAVRAHDLAL